MSAKVILEGVVGSTAYGLAHEGSDVDTLGMFVAPTEAFHGLKWPKESIVTTNPDKTLHEAGKWCRLALNCNPTVMELVWLGEHTATSDIGKRLIEIRESFLSERRVRNAYLGYATQQLKKILSRTIAGPNGESTFSSSTKGRTAKHARHLRRLCEQGVALHQTGELPIRVSDPDAYMDFGERVARGDTSLLKAEIDEAAEAFDGLGCLPVAPDLDVVNQWLLDLRDENYEKRKK